MSFARAAIGGTLLWVGLITLLHLYVNHGGNWGEPRAAFKVGFLPVT